MKNAFDGSHWQTEHGWLRKESLSWINQQNSRKEKRTKLKRKKKKQRTVKLSND